MIGIRQEHNQRQNKWLPNPAVIWFHEIVYEENYRKRRWSWPQIAGVSTTVTFEVMAKHAKPENTLTPP